MLIVPVHFIRYELGHRWGGLSLGELGWDQTRQFAAALLMSSFRREGFRVTAPNSRTRVSASERVARSVMIVMLRFAGELGRMHCSALRLFLVCFCSQLYSVLYERSLLYCKCFHAKSVETNPLCLSHDLSHPLSTNPPEHLYKNSLLTRAE